jgi:Protein of unknown function (DUF1360)
MDTWPIWTRLLVAVLATWRVSHLVVEEDGPWDLVARLRARAGQGPIGRLMDCFYCTSLWIAAPLALVVAREPVAWAVCWLAVSGGASLLERATGGARADRAGALERKEDLHGVLWEPTPGRGVVFDDGRAREVGDEDGRSDARGDVGRPDVHR